MKRNFFVPIALVSSLALIVIAPLVPAVAENMMLWTSGLCAVLGVVALISCNFFDAIFSFLLALTFGLVHITYGPDDQRILAIRTAAITGFVLLNLVLLIGPWSRFTKTIEKIYKHRRHLGVSVFLLGLAHFSLLFGPYFDASFANTFAAFFTFFGFTALFVMFFMAITSWDWAQMNISSQKWRIYHALTLLLYLPVAAYALWVNLSQGLPIEPHHYVILASFIVFWILVAPWGLAPKLIKNLRGWKQLHTLVYVAYVALIIHSWEGFFLYENQPLQIAYWVLIAFVFGSHATGWIIKSKQDKALKEAEKNAETIKVNNVEYRSVGNIEDFEDGKGKRVLVGGIPVAIFKMEGKFYAWFAVCPHQKGPLERGKIINGYLTCPWHQWQFSIEDGNSPPGYKDCTNLYPTLTQNGKLFVSRIPVPKKRLT